MEENAVKQPLTGLIDKTVGWEAVSKIQSCLVTNPQAPFTCDDPLPVDAERDTLATLLASSRYLLVTTKSPQGAAFVQKSPFLARIKRVQNLRQSSH